MQEIQSTPFNAKLFKQQLLNSLKTTKSSTTLMNGIGVRSLSSVIPA